MNTFTVGSVLNPYKYNIHEVEPHFRAISLKYPARLNAMALDPSQIDVSAKGVYTPGEIIFSVDIYKDVSVTIRNDREIEISPTSPRRQLILHAVLLMRSALKIVNGFNIDVQTLDLRHCGLGSSSGLIAAVATAINELYGNPIDKINLIAYLAQNHGEEIDEDESKLQHVQCIGGSAASGLVSGGVKVLAGESVPIASMYIDSSYTVLIGVPNDFVAPDSKRLMELEIANMSKFIATGEAFRDKIGYRVTHETLPAMIKGDVRSVGKLIFDYRFDYGSIQNCSFVYPPVLDIAEKIRHLYEGGIVDVLALSSVGPAFFAVTRNPNETRLVFEQNNLRIYQAKIANEGYKIIAKHELV
jgi:predicted sugar kinase